MFGDKFTNYIEKVAPEIYRQNICIEGTALPTLEFERVNALIVHNSFLSDAQEGIAVFNPPNTYSDLSLVIDAGLECYKDALRKSSFCEKDLVPGMLVLYGGEIMEFKRWEDSKTGREIILANDDRYNTISIVPLEKISEITKYSGARTAPDIAGSRTRTPAIDKTLRLLLGVEEGQQMQLADSKSIIVCLPELILNVLKSTKINNMPFFDLFPSVTWTPAGEQRLGRDSKKRNPVFYFVGSVSSVYDVLRSEAGKNICALICDGPRAMRSASLISSMQSDYSLKKIFILDEVSSLESMSKFSKFGFQVWAWTQEDFNSTPIEQKPLSVVDVPYPVSFSQELHNELQDCISQLNRLNKMEESTNLKDFLISAYGLLNKLFQMPISSETLFKGPSESIQEHLEILRLKATILKGSLSPRNIPVVDKILSLSASAITSFSSDESKYEILLKTIKGMSARNTSIVVKRAGFIGPLDSLIEKNIYADSYNIVSSPRQIPYKNSTLIWTFRPDLFKYAESVLRVRKPVFVGYTQQAKELRAIEQQYNRMVDAYANAGMRAKILKIDHALLGVEIKKEEMTESKILEEFTGIENLILASSSLLSSYNQDEVDEGKVVVVKQVFFEGGFTAFFEPGHTLKVICPDGEDTKNVEQLEQGDKIIFLKNERSTVFEELVEYYGHRPEALRMLKASEVWRTALKSHKEKNNLSVSELNILLKNAGLERTELTIENWLRGKVICPPEDDYRPIDIIAEVTRDEFLGKNKDKVKNAARRVHSMRIKIGHYLARRIMQSVWSGKSFDDADPELGQKLDKVSSYAEIAEVSAVAPDQVVVIPSLANRLLGVEDF